MNTEKRVHNVYRCGGCVFVDKWMLTTVGRDGGGVLGRLRWGWFVFIIVVYHVIIKMYYMCVMCMYYYVKRTMPRGNGYIYATRRHRDPVLKRANKIMTTPGRFVLLLLLLQCVIVRESRCRLFVFDVKPGIGREVHWIINATTVCTKS